MRKLLIEYIDASKIKPWDRNPKKHNDVAIDNSMERFDITQPILIQKSSNRIIAGHGRYDAMIRRNMTEIPVIRLELSDSEAKAYALIDNQTVISGDWYDDLLSKVLGELKVELPDVDMTQFGFTEIRESEPQSQVNEKMELQPFEHYDYLLVLATNIHDWDAINELFDIKKVISKEVKGSKRIGHGRCISATKVLEVFRNVSDSHPKSKKRK